MRMWSGWRACCALVAGAALAAVAVPAQEPKSEWPKNIQRVLDQTQPLKHSRGGRLPLYLWPAIGAGKLDDARALKLVRLLDERGVGLISNWNQGSLEACLAEALPVARAQKKAGVPIITLPAVSAPASVAAFTALLIVCAVVLYLLTRSVLVPTAVFLVTEAALVTIYFVKSEWLEGAFPKVLNAIALFGRFDTFTNGVFDWSAILYFVSVALLFVLLALPMIRLTDWYTARLREREQVGGIV